MDNLHQSLQSSKFIHLLDLSVKKMQWLKCTNVPQANFGSQKTFSTQQGTKIKGSDN